MLAIIWLGLEASLHSLGKVTMIVVPLLVILEILKDMGWLHWVSQRVEPVLKPFYLSPEVAPALVVGLFLGLLAGAGLLYQLWREQRVKSGEMTVLCLFLTLNHAIIEDVAILAAIGARAWVLVLARFLPALLLTFLWGVFQNWLTVEKQKQPQC